MDEFEFDWEVLEIVNTEVTRGAVVRYTPLEENCSKCTFFVPVPFHKATSIDHAREIMERKIIAKAPSGVWKKELNPEPGDKSAEIVAALERGETIKGERRYESRTDTEGSRDQSGVSESGGHEGG